MFDLHVHKQIAMKPYRLMFSKENVYVTSYFLSKASLKDLVSIMDVKIVYKKIVFNLVQPSLADVSKHPKYVRTKLSKQNSRLELKIERINSILICSPMF